MLQQRSQTSLHNVVVSGNNARTGGAAYVASDSVLSCTESTVIGNSVETTGGAFTVDGARAVARTELALTRTALIGNSALVAAGTWHWCGNVDGGRHR